MACLYMYVYVYVYVWETVSVITIKMCRHISYHTCTMWRWTKGDTYTAHYNNWLSTCCLMACLQQQYCSTGGLLWGSLEPPQCHLPQRGSYNGCCHSNHVLCFLAKLSCSDVQNLSRDLTSYQSTNLHRCEDLASWHVITGSFFALYTGISLPWRYH